MLLLSGLLSGPLSVIVIYVLRVYPLRVWSHTLILFYCKGKIVKIKYLSHFIFFLFPPAPCNFLRCSVANYFHHRSHFQHSDYNCSLVSGETQSGRITEEERKNE